jgi:hypothetical protein
MKKPEINWIRAGAEFVVIVVGVLVALWVDNWNQDRENVALEREYLLRLERDIRADSLMHAFLLTSLDEKAAALELITEAVARTAPFPSDPRPFLQALGKDGNNFGWGFPLLQSVTFEDLTDTGNLGLLRDAEMRDSIIGYYQNGNHRLNRMSARRTGYLGLLYQILPPEVFAAFPQTDPRAPGSLARMEAEVPEPVDLSMVEANELMNHLRRDDFRRALNAEMNFAQFAKGQVRENLDQASALLSFFRARSDLR